MKYPDLKCGTMEAVVNKLGGMEGVERFLAGELVVKPVERVFAVWRTITLGLHKSVDAYIVALESAGFKIGDIARRLFGNVAFSTEQVTLDLFTATVAELGFPEGATFAQICARVVKLGYKLCQGEAVLALRLVYANQPMHDKLYVAMEPILDDGDSRVFLLESIERGQYLSSHCLTLDVYWHPSYRWVFCRVVSK